MVGSLLLVRLLSPPVRVCPVSAVETGLTTYTLAPEVLLGLVTMGMFGSAFIGWACLDVR